jgi:hypothetical protein
MPKLSGRAILSRIGVQLRNVIIEVPKLPSAVEIIERRVI